VRALHLFKYTRVLSAGKALSLLAAAHFPLLPKDYDLILPVPLHLARLRWREFNQALVLARAVGKRYRLPVDPFSLERIRATDPQVRLKEKERQTNVHDAFAITRPEKVKGKRILLVDDVYTTGATVNECARTLCTAGARYVDVFTLTRAVLH
jgi:ComF family protein